MEQQTKLHFGPNTKGYVAIMNRNQGLPMFCRVKDVERALAARSLRDLYVSLNTFARPNHAAKNVWQYSAVYVGCDTRAKGIEPEDALDEMRKAYFGSPTMPTPSYAILSGNGVWLVWLIDPVTAGRRKEWQHVQHHFSQMLWLFGPDPNDASKYIRVAGSYNSSSRSTVRLEVLSGERYSLDSLRHYAPPLPVATAAPTPRPQKQASNEPSPKRRRKSSLLARLRDLETLCQLRHWHLDNCRNHLLTIYASTLYTITRDEEAVLSAALALNEQFSAPLHTSQVRAIARTCARKVYRWRTETIIERLMVTDAEQQQMRSIVSQPNRSQRASSMAREAHNRFTKARERVQAIAALKTAGVTSNREIARRLGITEGAVRHVLKRLDGGA